VADEIQPLLAEATWEDIAEELNRRFTVVLLAVIKDPGKTNEYMRYRLHGGCAAGCGLAEWVKSELLKGVAK
jgi:hypothetical protein